MSAETERFASSEELRSLFDDTHNWLVDHGNPRAARGVVGHAPDGIVIADDPATFNASLPVSKLRQVVPDHMRTLDIARRLHLVTVLPAYINDEPLDLDTSFAEYVMITTGHGRSSAFRDTTYCLDQTELVEGSTIHRTAKITEHEDEGADLSVYLDRLVSATAALALEARAAGMRRITFSQYTALHAIVSVWSERCLELSPGPSRRYKWK